MIKEITDTVNLVFKNHENNDCTDCINDIFDFFGDNINDKNMEYRTFIDKLYFIFIEYAPNIKQYYWQSIITVNINTIPMEVLWDIFQKEQKKHS